MNQNDIFTFSCGTFSNNILSHIINNEEIQMLYEISQGISEINPNCMFDINESKSLINHPRAVFIDKKENLSINLTDELVQDIKLMKDFECDYNTSETNEFKQDFRNVKNNLSKKDKAKVTNFEILSNMPHKAYPSLLKVTRQWSDFLHTNIHAKSILPIKECNHIGSNVGELLEESIHYFAERSDRLQGFHYFTDISSEYAQLNGKILEYMKDEYPKKCIYNFATFPWWRFKNLEIKNFHDQILSASIVLQQAFHDVDAFYPLSIYGKMFEYQTYSDHNRNKHFLYEASNIKPLNPLNDYQLSALFALGIDAATLPYRTLRNPNFDMKDLINLLNFEDQINKVRAISSRYFFDEVDDDEYLTKLPADQCAPVNGLFSLTPYNVPNGSRDPNSHKSYNITRGIRTIVLNDKQDKK